MRKFKEKKVEITPKTEGLPEEKTSSGRQENYFFPKYMKTIRAGSLQEATAKIKEGEK